MKRRDAIGYFFLVISIITFMLAYASGFVLVFYKSPNAFDFAILNLVFFITSTVTSALYFWDDIKKETS